MVIATIGQPELDSEDSDSALLGRYTRELYFDPRLVPLLHRLAVISCRLLNGRGASISLVDATRRRYLKVAEHGTHCMIGHSFPVDEGVTGCVMSSRRPVVLASYRDIEHGHMPSDSPAWDGAVVAVPMWWQGEIIGANVVFAGCPRRFNAGEVRQLDSFTAAAVPGIVTASAVDPSLGHLARPLRLTESVPESAVATRHIRVGVECPLSGRELEVVGLLASGHSTRSVAAELGISPKTVEKHVGSVLRKTKSANRTEAVALALESGWSHTEPDRRSSNPVQGAGFAPYTA